MDSDSTEVRSKIQINREKERLTRERKKKKTH